jgi:hypothetical protein
MMVLSEAPLSLRAITPPAQRLCEEIRFRVYPRKRSPSRVAPHRTAVPISRSETLELRPDLWYTVSMVPVWGPRWTLAMRLAMAATGQIGPANASWWMMEPLVPFFVFAIQMVALSVRRSVASLM